VCQKNETRILLNILFSCKSIAMKFIMYCNEIYHVISWWPWILNAYIICHLTLVCFYSTWHYTSQGLRRFINRIIIIINIIIKTKNLCCLPLSSMNGSEKTDLVRKWLWKEPAVWLVHNRCLKWRLFAFTRAHGRVWHWSMALSMMPWGIRSMLQLVNVACQVV